MCVCVCVCVLRQSEGGRERESEEREKEKETEGRHVYILRAHLIVLKNTTSISTDMHAMPLVPRHFIPTHLYTCVCVVCVIYVRTCKHTCMHAYIKYIAA